MEGFMRRLAALSLACAALPLILGGADDASPIDPDTQRVLDALKVKDADIRVFANRSLTDGLIGLWNALPESQKTVSFDSTAQSGQLYSQGGGGLGCGGYAELQGPGDFHLTAAVPQLATKWGESALAVSATYTVNVRAQFHVHVKGPPGPHRNQWWEIPWLSCDSAIGGGAGTSIGASAAAQDMLAGSIVLSPNADGQIGYALNLDGTPERSITVRAGLGALGNVGIPVKYKLPTGPIISGTIPALYEYRGSLQAPAQGTTKEYRLQLSSIKSSLNPSGLALSAVAVVGWGTRTRGEFKPNATPVTPASRSRRGFL
jgi:hypothetical protein